MTRREEGREQWHGWPLSRSLVWLFIVAAILYVALLPRHYVGSFNDDALYVITALSLLKGRFATLCLPQEPAMNHFLPGFPLVLAPFVYCIQPHWAALKLTSVFWTLASGAMLWVLARRFLSKGFSVLVVGAFLLNPTVVDFSSVVMAEPVYVFAIGGIWLLFIRLLEDETPRRLWTFAGVLAWTCLLRQEAILLSFCLGGALWYAQRVRLAIKAIGPAILCWSAFLLRNQWTTGSLSDYLPYWHASSGGLRSASPAWGSQALAMLDTLFVKSIAGLALAPESRLRVGLVPFLIVCGLSLTLYGFLLMWKRRPSDRPFLWALASFYLFYSVLHSVWYVSDPRYTLPLIPWAWLFLVNSGEDLWLRRRPIMRWTVGSLLGLSLIGYLDQNSYALYKTVSRSGPSYRQLPRETLDWVANHIPEKARLMSNKIETIYLYTGRQGYFILPAVSAPDLHTRLTAQGVRYIVFQSEPSLDKALEKQWGQTMLWASGRADLFSFVYLNRSEQSLIFEVDE